MGSREDFQRLAYLRAKLAVQQRKFFWAKICVALTVVAAMFLVLEDFFPEFRLGMFSCLDIALSLIILSFCIAVAIELSSDEP